MGHTGTHVLSPKKTHTHKMARPDWPKLIYFSISLARRDFPIALSFHFALGPEIGGSQHDLIKNWTRGRRSRDDL